MIPSTLGFPMEVVLTTHEIPIYVCRPRAFLVATAWERPRWCRYLPGIAIRLRDERKHIDKWGNGVEGLIGDMDAIVSRAIADDWLQAIGVIKHLADTYESNPLTPIEESTT